jgi:hypothetical protein
MIDLESLNQGGLHEFSFMLQFLSNDANLRQQQVAEFTTGYTSMHTKIQNQLHDVLDLLQQYPFAQAYAPRHVQHPPNPTINMLLGFP